MKIGAICQNRYAVKKQSTKNVELKMPRMRQWRIDPYFNAGNAGIGFKPYISPEGAKENVMDLIPPPFQGGTIIINSLPRFENRGYMPKPLRGKNK